VEPDQAMWQTGAELGAVAVAIDAGELAAYRLARMSARLVQGLSGGAGDPEAAWQTLAASCTTDFAIARTLRALGRGGPLQGHRVEVRGIRRVQALAAVEAPCVLTAGLRVLCSERGADGVDVTMVVTLTRGAAPVASFELELRLRRHAAA